jgi:hypothetical protein
MTWTAWSAVSAHSRPSRSRSMPNRPGVALRWRDMIASLPIATPAAFTPISAPHIHAGRLSRAGTCRRGAATSIQVARTTSPSRVDGRDTSRPWGSPGSRSLFLANHVSPERRSTTVSHIVAAFPDGTLPRRRYGSARCCGDRAHPPLPTRPEDDPP